MVERKVSEWWKDHPEQELSKGSLWKNFDRFGSYLEETTRIDQKEAASSIPMRIVQCWNRQGLGRTPAEWRGPEVVIRKLLEIGLLEIGLLEIGLQAGASGLVRWRLERVDLLQQIEALAVIR